jgi:hypothetical protein
VLSGKPEWELARIPKAGKLPAPPARLGNAALLTKSGNFVALDDLSKYSHGG